VQTLRALLCETGAEAILSFALSCLFATKKTASFLPSTSWYGKAILSLNLMVIGQQDSFPQPHGTEKQFLPSTSWYGKAILSLNLMVIGQQAFFPLSHGVDNLLSHYLLMRTVISHVLFPLRLLVHFFLLRLLKGTVRPDWICMRVISLESPLKGHQPLHVFNFLVLILNIL
jgi:hypothetical protein